MKKFLLIPLLLFVLLPYSFVNSPYNISPGNTYNYDVKQSSIRFSLCNTTFKGNGFLFNDIFFPRGSTISASVTSLGADNVLWTLSSGSESASKIADWDIIDESSLSQNILNPFSIINPFLSNPSLASSGLGLLFYPFLGTNRTITFFQTIANETHSYYNFFTPKLSNFQYNATYLLKDSFITFESLITGFYNQTSLTPFFALSFTHHTQFAYDVSLGLLNGSRFLSEGSGMYNNSFVEYSLKSHIELQNYNLPRLTFLSNETTVLLWLLYGVDVSMFVVIVVIHLSRSKK